MPRVDITDHKQNAFVQDWLSQYQRAYTNTIAEVNAFELVIEMIQETYSPMPHNVRTADWDNEA